SQEFEQQLRRVLHVSIDLRNGVAVGLAIADENGFLEPYIAGKPEDAYSGHAGVDLIRLLFQFLQCTVRRTVVVHDNFGRHTKFFANLPRERGEALEQGLDVALFVERRNGNRNQASHQDLAERNSSNQAISPSTGSRLAMRCRL